VTVLAGIVADGPAVVLACDSSAMCLGKDGPIPNRLRRKIYPVSDRLPLAAGFFGVAEYRTTAGVTVSLPDIMDRLRARFDGGELDRRTYTVEGAARRIAEEVLASFAPYWTAGSAQDIWVGYVGGFDVSGRPAVWQSSCTRGRASCSSSRR
jgi:hypothetical protein